LFSSHGLDKTRATAVLFFILFFWLARASYCSWVYYTPNVLYNGTLPLTVLRTKLTVTVLHLQLGVVET